jgi:hypothetical protein
VSVKDRVRAAVIRTNDRWPFSRLNRVPYLLAIRAFVQLCRRYPAIKSVYLRHGMLRRDWAPALSDIDLTIVMEGGRTTDEAFAFLRSYWRDHARLKAVFPMLGDVDILDERHVAAWTTRTIRGYEAKDWRLLYGAPTVRSHYRADPERLRHDAFEYGLLFYLGYFRHGFFADQPFTELRSRELERLAVGIARYLSGYRTALVPDGPIGVPPRRDRAGLLSWLMKHLEMNAPQLVPDLSPDGSAKHDSVVRDRPELGEAQVVQLPVDESEMPVLQEGVESLYLADGDCFIVLRDHLEDANSRRCASIAWNCRYLTRGGPIVLSRRVFEYMLRVHAPLRYGSLASRRALAYGPDIVCAIPPPTDAALVDHVLDQTDKVLTMPQRPGFFSPLDTLGNKGATFGRQLDRCLHMSLYLEAGSIPRSKEQLVEETRARYAEHYRELGSICDRFDRDDWGSTSRALFGLFRTVTQDVHQQLEGAGSLGRR